ncbi:4Fe-4S dicluster domain-containing protein [Candidatus Solincola tengchongensis]|uniref:2Fe-2S iron-sulfur cluster-binding protein n=1 Tax=Candidatus Solincola tengchongensis TaxID=2900693 RepID=UPI002579A0EB
MKGEVCISINGKKCQAREGEPVLQAARRNGFFIPSLCYHEALEPYAACRLCLVEVLGGPAPAGVTTSCTLRASEGLEVLTECEEVASLRRIVLELHLARAPEAEVVRSLAETYGVKAGRLVREPDPSDPLGNRCVLCGLCVRVCSEALGVGAIDFIGRGYATRVNTPYLEASSVCTGCGACAEVCPTGAVRWEEGKEARVMHSWSGTAVPFRKCARCGRSFGPDALAAYAYARVPDLDASLRDLCPDCRRKDFSQRTLFYAANPQSVE